jgi:hypothetical protein
MAKGRSGENYCMNSIATKFGGARGDTAFPQDGRKADSSCLASLARRNDKG